MELLMSHDNTKTLGLGIQDWEENNKMGFIWSIAWEQLVCDKILMDVFWIGWATGLSEDYIYTQTTYQSQTKSHKVNSPHKVNHLQLI
jgi:hypothetical protein